MTVKLQIEPLSRTEFSPFGEVIETEGAERFTINQGTTERYNNLSRVDVLSQGGWPQISIFRSQPRPQPIRLDLMERHPLGTQAFYPLQDRAWLAVVAKPDADPLDPSSLRAFRATGQQGVSYARNVWHHPLLVLEPDSDFLIVDRGGPGNNLEEREFTRTIVLATG